MFTISSAVLRFNGTPTVAKLRVPASVVLRNWPLVPSAVGSVSVKKGDVAAAVEGERAQERGRPNEEEARRLQRRPDRAFP